MRKILIFVPNYFPGYLSGGIARSILNTTEWLGDDIEFQIATQDRDLGACSPYPNVAHGVWVPVGKARVRYLAPDELSLSSLTKFVNETSHDVLHLNSFFDSIFTIKLLMLLRLKKISSTRVLLSPRGEFGLGSLGIKYPKKRVYMEVSKLAGFYRGVTWHASSHHEAKDTISALRVPSTSVRAALDLPVLEASLPFPSDSSGSQLKVVYLARLTREKNLDGALRILQGVKTPITFDIVGPQEDPKYWDECAVLLSKLPSNVQANYLGPVSPSEVFDTLARYDLTFLPSHGENYGHVIAESISVGTRVLISHATPWHKLQDDGVGWDIDLNNTQQFVDVIEAMARLSSVERAAVRANVRKAAAARLFDPKVLEDNRSLYLKL